MSHTIKFLNDDTLEICAIPYGGHLPGGSGTPGGRDTDGEYFTKRTDLCLDWFPNDRPLLYDHGADSYTKSSVIGRVNSATAEQRDDGWWVRAQLDRKSRYVSQMRALIEQDGLYASSGAMPHLVQKSRGGEILVWPWVEVSLTPTPANMFARVTAANVAKHYKSAGLIDELSASIAQADDDRPLPAVIKAWIQQCDDEDGLRVGRVLNAGNEKGIRDAIAMVEDLNKKLTSILATLGG